MIKKTNYLVLIEAINSNPNGDPDNENAPRMDPDTEYGIITNQCLNRKVRNQVMLHMDDKSKYDIFIQTDKTLNEKQKDAFAETGFDITKSGNKPEQTDIQKAKQFMLAKYFDIRTFGAVLSTGDYPAGRVTGAVQTSFARTVTPVTIQEVALTRQALTNDNRKNVNAENEMGKKYIVPYGLYAFKVSVSAVQAEKNGFTQDDLNVYENALMNMFENDESSARGDVNVRAVYRFTHENKLGNVPTWKIYDLVHIDPNKEYPRSFNDFDIYVDEDKMPEGITVEQIL